MLPSRLFRNMGIAPPLRSLITPHPSLPAFVSVQLRFRLGVGVYRAASSGPQTQASASSLGSNATPSGIISNESPSAESSLSAPPASSTSQFSGSHTHRLQTDPLE